ncbi:unnamed protein product [Adineta steineri]|uniref:Aldose 1-epimerase n=2 Tax=Adineta steineri TaxID=433720 RepID=A0A818NWW8_9BILA|nr:unnamed protein product [Adineta steineri]CAF3611628.1 unnamed protein product [Adineta steineri]
MSQVTLKKSLFDITKDHNESIKYTLSTSDGFEIALIDYGATIQSIRQPDKQNHIEEITLGYDTLQGYIDDKCYFGCTVGRVTNRIKNGYFQLDGIDYQLEKNDNAKHHLHGVFNKHIWNSSTENNDTVIFKYQSPDGEDGFPGEVHVTVKYTLTNDHRLIMDFYGKTTKPTPINMTNHTYFNLSGNTNETILDHQLIVPANQFTPLDEEHIPTGQIAPVENTPNDFRKLTCVGDHIHEIPYAYNVMFIINGEGKRSFGKLVHSKSGRAINIESTQKALQFYTGTYLDNVNGRERIIYKKYSGLCLETQNYTDSVNNQPQFPSTILRPGEEYHEQTIFHFYLE